MCSRRKYFPLILNLKEHEMNKIYEFVIKNIESREALFNVIFKFVIR